MRRIFIEQLTLSVFSVGMLVVGCKTNLQQKESNDTELREEIVFIKKGERPRLTLIERGKKNNSDVNVEFTLSKLNEYIQPRVAEVFVNYSKNLNYRSFEKGEALADAQKQLFVQQSKEGELRLIILASDNTNRIGSGTLATLTFEKTGDAEATVGISTDKPIFAPEEANVGLLVSDPIHI